MVIYISSSWKNQHAVEMLTDLLRAKGHVVRSFVEKAGVDEDRDNIKFDLDRWIHSEDGWAKFQYDTNGAIESELVIYIGPSGPDSWAEIGAAYGSGVRILGLWAKGESVGLMRRMVTWYTNYRNLLEAIPEPPEKMRIFAVGGDR